MSNIDLIRMGVKNLWRRKLRTFLTILGVIIGASSIIVMLSLGFGMSASFEAQVAQRGDLTTINVRKEWADPSMPAKKQIQLNSASVLEFKNLPNVLAVSPVLEVYGKLINGKYQSELSIEGIDPDSMESFGFVAEEGRLLNKSDGLSVVFGYEVANTFHDSKSTVWKEITIDPMKDRMAISIEDEFTESGQENKNPKQYKIKPAGILNEGNWQTNYKIFVPINELEKIVKEKEKNQNRSGKRDMRTGYDQVNIKVSDMDSVEQVQNVIKEMGYEAYSLTDELKASKEQALVIQAVLGGIGAISLFVAAIGITNTMVMSIYERTKEIGVMKVIGASIKDIKRLFLFESALIGLTGGLFGVGLSYAISFLMNSFGGEFIQMMGTGGDSKISIIPIWLSLAALAFSALIGIASGYFPARRAMNLSALEAIKTE